MKNKYTTDATFVSIDGKIVSYQEIFAGAESYAKTLERKGLISEADAENLAQDAMCNIVLASARYDTRKVTSPMAYGYTVAKNRNFDIWKEKSRYNTTPLSFFEMKDDEGHSFYSPAVDAWRSDEFSADRKIISDETCAPIEDFVSSLDGDNKVAMKMTMMGAKAEAIAHELGCTPRAAAIRVCKLRKQVDKELRNGDPFFRIK